MGCWFVSVFVSTGGAPHGEDPKSKWLHKPLSTQSWRKNKKPSLQHYPQN